MREILFRAKQKNWRDLPKKEWWVEGYFFDDGFQNPEHYFDFCEIDRKYL